MRSRRYLGTKKKMNEDDIDLLATIHLGAYGISKQSLRQALSLYDVTRPSNARGRPDRVIAQAVIFTIYYQATEVLGLTEQEITNKQLAAIANSARIHALNDLKTNGSSRESQNEFKAEITESSVKKWRREFRALRESEQERFHKVFELLQTLRQ